MIAGLPAILLLVASFVSPPQIHSRAITNVAVSSTGRWLAAGTHDGRVALCDRTIAGTCTMVDIESDELNDLQFSPDERFLAVSNSNIRLIALDHRSILFFYAWMDRSTEPSASITLEQSFLRSMRKARSS